MKPARQSGPFAPIGSHVAQTLVAAAFLQLAHTADAARHDEHPGPGVAVHYVRLSGHGGDNERRRRNWAVKQKACFDHNVSLGKPAVRVAPGDVPEIIQIHQFEIYYAAERTATLNDITLNEVDLGNCAPIEIKNRVLKLTSIVGECSIDLIRNVARGLCGRGPVALGRPHLPQPPMARLATAEHRSFDGVTCQVQAAPLLKWQVCIATPETNPRQRLDPHTIAAAPLNSGFPGILLELISQPLTLQAQEVQLNLSVAPELFEIPAGAIVNPGPGLRR